MDSDAYQIDEILDIIKEYYNRYPYSAPVVFRDDIVYHIRKIIRKIGVEEEE